MVTSVMQERPAQGEGSQWFKVTLECGVCGAPRMSRAWFALWRGLHTLPLSFPTLSRRRPEGPGRELAERGARGWPRGPGAGGALAGGGASGGAGALGPDSPAGLGGQLRVSRIQVTKENRF